MATAVAVNAVIRPAYQQADVGFPQRLSVVSSSTKTAAATRRITGVDHRKSSR
jgi:hypothetical protein